MEPLLWISVSSKLRCRVRTCYLKGEDGISILRYNIREFLTSCEYAFTPTPRETCREARLIRSLVIAESCLERRSLVKVFLLGQDTYCTHIAVYSMYNVFGGQMRDLRVGLDEEICEVL